MPTGFYIRRNKQTLEERRLKKKEGDKKYYLKNKERLLNKCKEYRLSHKEQIKETQKRWVSEHREKIREIQKRYKERHPERYREIHNRSHMKRRHETGENKKYLSEMGFSYTPEYQKMHSQSRRKRMKEAGYLKIADIVKVYDDNLINNGGALRCIYCHRELTMAEATLEYKQPLSRDGTNDKENLAIACKNCNLSKGDKTVKEFLEYQTKGGSYGSVGKSIRH